MEKNHYSMTESPECSHVSCANVTAFNIEITLMHPSFMIVLV